MNSWLSYSIMLLLGTTVFGISGEVTSKEGADSGLPGITKPSLQVTLHPNVAGMVHEMLVKEGDFVRAGQPIVRMDDRVASANLNAAEVAAAQTGPVELARAELAAAEQTLRRLESVTDLRAVAAQEFELARSSVEKAQANLNTAEGNLLLAHEKVTIERERINQLSLVAPFDGIVHRIKANPGERLQEDQPVLDVVNVDTLKVELHIPSSRLEELVVGQVYTLGTNFRGVLSIEAKLTSIAPIVDPSTDTLRCIFEIDNRDMKLPAGFVVHFTQQ
jgi:membrane fusion protein (multidrug efflux system)